MKKNYERFQLLVVCVEEEDVITTSPELMFDKYDNWFPEEDNENIW